MYIHNRLENKSNFFQKIKQIDYILLISILILGMVSIVTMYSTDGGQILFYTKSHFTKFVIFSALMLVISFFNIRLWFSISYFAYLILVLMLIWTINFGVTASGSQRWMDLYFINIQPSELAKITLILVLASILDRKRFYNISPKIINPKL